MIKIEFETFRDLNSSYAVNQLKQDEPSCINFLNYRKYKVTIELIEESKEILIGRLEKLKTINNFHRRQMIDNELKKF